MRCPHCETTDLLMTERAGIEIDYCPKCRGVWLDRGELDKLIERSAAQVGAPSAAPVPNAPQQQQYASPPPQQYAAPYPHQGKPDDSHYGYPSPHGKRKKSWLSDIFD